MTKGTFPTITATLYLMECQRRKEKPHQDQKHTLVSHFATAKVAQGGRRWWGRKERSWWLHEVWERAPHTAVCNWQVPQVLVPAGQHMDTWTIQCTFVSHLRPLPSLTIQIHPHAQQTKNMCHLLQLRSQSHTPAKKFGEDSPPLTAMPSNLQFIPSSIKHQGIVLFRSFYDDATFLQRRRRRMIGFQCIRCSQHSSAALWGAPWVKPTVQRKTCSLMSPDMRKQTPAIAALVSVSWTDSTF